MNYAIAGGAIVRRFDPFLSIQHNQSNKLTGHQVMMFGHKSWLSSLVDFLRQKGRP